MNSTTSPEIKIRIVCGGSTNSIEKDQISKRSTYDSFLDLLKESNIIYLNKNYLVFLVNKKGGKLEVDKTNYDQLKNRVLTQSSEDDHYFLVQDDGNSAQVPQKADKGGRSIIFYDLI